MAKMPPTILANWHSARATPAAAWTITNRVQEHEGRARMDERMEELTKYDKTRCCNSKHTHSLDAAIWTTLATHACWWGLSDDDNGPR